MTSSLRLAEAFARAATPQGHPEIRGLADLRRHMGEDHGLGGVAGMLPQRVLLHMHAAGHQDEGAGWQGSPDSAGNTGFIARHRVIVTGMLRYTPHVREVLPLHMISHHGWTPDEVSEALEWPEAANALPGHHDREHAMFGDHPPEHRIPHAHEDVSFDLDAPAWEPPGLPDHP